MKSSVSSGHPGVGNHLYRRIASRKQVTDSLVELPGRPGVGRDVDISPQDILIPLIWLPLPLPGYVCLPYLHVGTLFDLGIGSILETI